MKKIPVLVLSSLLLLSCQNQKSSFQNSSFMDSDDSSVEEEKEKIPDDKYRNYYEIFVYSFSDSNKDGIGDLKGIEEKLDYLRDIGYTGIWLTPIFSSPSYHKYDIQDYFSIDKAFGTMDDLISLVQKAHSLGMKVLLDGVFNHSSINNPWFEKALLAHRKLLRGESLTKEEENYNSLYVFVDKKEDMDSEKTYSKAGANDFYYECNFSTDMPEFNFESEFTYQKIESVIDYYMSDKIQIDGFRLDAVLYYDYMNTYKNVQILNRISSMIHNHDGYVVGECFSDQKTIGEYYLSITDSFFYFPAQGQNGFIHNSLSFQGESKLKYLEGLKEMIKNANGYIPAPFLDNHDVSRLSKEGNMAQFKFLLGLRDMLNGNTFNYYGDEIGMSSSVIKSGDYADSCYRTHYYWDDETHAMECSDPPHALTQKEVYGDSKTQLADTNSILNYEKNALKMRNTYPSIARGDVLVSKEDETMNNDSDTSLLLAFEKQYGNEHIKLVFNFSMLETSSYSLNGWEVKKVLLADTNQKETIEDGKINLPPYSIALLK